MAGADAAVTEPALVIRTMRPDEVATVSALIVRTLRETNAKHYSSQEIESLVAGFMPDAYPRRVRGRHTLVAERGGTIVGTAALGQERINTVFVSPDEQGRGIGAALMEAVEQLARSAGWTVAQLNASRTAVGFYGRLGYVVAHDGEVGPNTIRMRKPLQAPDPTPANPQGRLPASHGGTAPVDC